MYFHFILQFYVKIRKKWAKYVQYVQIMQNMCKYVQSSVPQTRLKVFLTQFWHSKP